VVAASLTWADIDATAAYAQGAEATRRLETRPGRSGLVIWDDHSMTTAETVVPQPQQVGSRAVAPARQFLVTR
jgi:thiamine biosynthesis lipoprotein